jgi:hypothetical protein
MLAVRAASLADRRAIYKRDRIGNQHEWYINKSKTHLGAAKFWLWVSGSASVVGIAAAVIKFIGVVDVDLLGVAAAVASAAIAWNQLSQNRNQAIAYDVTATELSIIVSRIDSVEDAKWAEFVSDSEDAMSREHTLWLARHGQQAISIKEE